MVGRAEFISHLSTIRRGYYGLLDVGAKLGILRELVAQVLETGIFKEKLDEYIKEWQSPVATNREKAKAEVQAADGHVVGFQGSNSTELVTKQNGATDQSEPLRYRFFCQVITIYTPV